MTTTVSGLIERIRRTWLEPPDYQPPLTLLSKSIATDATEVELSEFTVPEDERLVAAGSLLEIGGELMRITSWDAQTRIATVDRAKYGTDDWLEYHNYGAVVRLAPTWPRISIYESIGDNISVLSPQLFTVRQVELSTVAYNVAPIGDDLALDVISAWPPHGNIDNNIGGRIVDHHPLAGGRAVILDGGLQGNFWLRYSRRTVRPTTESDELEDLGVEPDWVPIIMAGVAADLYVGRDLPASSTEWVGAALQAENIPVGTRYQIASGLLSYRDRLLKKANAEMRTEYRPRVRIRSVFE